ncbi:SDR family oxidoreductase [Streptomyces sp. N2-109]|uniref:SDR family oxidoreductase n=1 Tax=Streptomyces gossypii TaxID=2883101 RepID=A0ABT2K3J6_9ACTN|nr:SDR family oxidoreductase [Streptomyces gossypii]MCT2594749.1 SDR family oxidoreductase [Streptomyces gossypii]
MKLTVLGATGRTGRHLVTHALADGHEVTAAVRNPAKLPLEHENLSVVRADALDAASVKDAVGSADAVLSGIGPSGRHDPLKPASTSARAAVEAMTALGVRRLIVISAAPLNRTGEGQPRSMHRVWSPLLWAVFKEWYGDLVVMEEVLRQSDLDWTALRPPQLKDKPGQGRYRHTVGAGPVGSTIPFPDVARAMLDLVDDRATYGQVVGVSS